MLSIFKKQKENRQIEILKFKLECTEKAYIEQCEMNKNYQEMNMFLLQSIQKVCNLKQMEQILELNNKFLQEKQVKFLEKCLKQY